MEKARGEHLWYVEKFHPLDSVIREKVAEVITFASSSFSSLDQLVLVFRNFMGVIW